MFPRKIKLYKWALCGNGLEFSVDTFLPLYIRLVNPTESQLMTFDPADHVTSLDASTQVTHGENPNQIPSVSTNI